MKHKYTSKLFILLSTFFSAIAFSINTFAISPVISLSTTSVEITEGQNSYIDIDTTDFSGTVRVFSSDSNIATAKMLSCSSSDTCTLRNEKSTFSIRGISSGETTVQVMFSGNMASTGTNINEVQNVSVYIRNSDATLSNLTVSPIGINFDKNTTEYTISAEHNVDYIDITATASDPRTSISGIGRFELKDYLNTFQVTTVAEDGSSITYKVSIKRKDSNGRTAASSKKSENKKSDDNKLKDILIPDTDFEFKEDTEEYSITVKPDVEVLVVRAISNSKNAKVEIEGNEHIEFGENIVKIVVTAENGDIKIYTIRVTRPAMEDETLVIKNSKDGNRNVLGVTANGSKFNGLTIALIIVGVATVIGAILTAIFIKKKTTFKRKQFNVMRVNNNFRPNSIR